ncbi:site-specific DNA-methyltransferase [Azospirillum himalayense]|uniref:site-specific DNA-methyltransferase (adenine-specific) n=1 Tax=Azospirillum himalayense TaxID=654847 RepID=A0ABW0G9D0_9PROT
MTARDYDGYSREDLLRLLRERDADEAGGLRLSYAGQTPPWRIIRRVQPRRQKIEPKFCWGTEEEQACNMLAEGENLQTMVSLYKYRGQVDLIVTDPPYNTGEDFRYNDRWDEDPNDPDLGALVPAEDGSRHSKWLRFMVPRLWMMKEMLRPGGVLAICIDHRELFRLGMVLDEMFGEANRIAIINWQKSYSPKNNVGKRTHVSTSTEYVLVYAKNIDRAKTILLPRSEAMNARYSSIDGDPEPWAPGDLTGPGADSHYGQVYAIQSPFTGQLMYPGGGRCWAAERPRMKKMLEAWGCTYTSKDLGDGKAKALVIKGSLAKAKEAAEAVLKAGTWPVGYWRDNGLGNFRVKVYLKDVKKGVVPMTYWADETYDEPDVLGTTSWDHEQSGHSQTGLKELDALVGRDHGFETVKPLKLFKKIIQIWCPPKGIVLDPFAGSGTTGHAVLELNADNRVKPTTGEAAQSDTASENGKDDKQKLNKDRRFILIEQGRPERGDAYARTLTCLRLKRAITGERVTKEGKVIQGAEPLSGGFRFSKLTTKVDADAVLTLEREEMLDLLLTAHWDQRERASSHLRRLPAGEHAHLFAISARGEGFFLIWNGPDKPSILDRVAFRKIAEEAKAANLTAPYHVYARQLVYSGPNIEFYQIPDRILEKIGFNDAVQPYYANQEELEGDTA